MRFVLITFFILVNVNILFAQPGDPGGDPDNPVPLTGIEFLLAGGAVIGARRILNHFSSEKPENKS
jgi:hypothetical protein